MLPEPAEIECFRQCAEILWAASNGMEIRQKLRMSRDPHLCWVTKPYSEPFDFTRYEYQLAKPIMEDIDWDNIPESFDWVAVEDTGESYAYNVEPYFLNGHWACRGPSGTSYVKLPDLHKVGGYFAVFERPVPKGKVKEYMTGDGFSAFVEYTAERGCRWSAVAYLLNDDTPIEGIYGENGNRDELTKEIRKQLDKKFGPVSTLVDGSISVDDKVYGARAEKVANGSRWIAYIHPSCGIGYEPAYGATSEEAFAVLTQNFCKAVAEFNKKSVFPDCTRLYDWFCDEEVDQPSVEACIMRLEEMRRAEIILRSFIHDYEKGHAFLNQDQFPGTKE